LDLSAEADEADLSMLSRKTDTDVENLDHGTRLSMLSRKTDTDVENLDHGTRMSGEFAIQGYPKLEDVTFSEE
jgi:hypothetical protein